MEKELDKIIRGALKVAHTITGNTLHSNSKRIPEFLLERALEQGYTPQKFVEEFNQDKEMFKDWFCCEICHEFNKRVYEGSEPNTCAMCMPLEMGEKDSEI